MNLKTHFHSLLVPLCGFIALLASPLASALNVTNGDFNDLTGLTDQSGGWYQGAPADWTSTAGTPGYAVYNAAGFGNATPAFANLGQLSTLRQDLGTTASASLVTVSFDIGTFGGAPTVDVRITNGGSVVYASANYTSGSGLTLSAYTNAGSPVYVEFVKIADTPWLDNVSVSDTPGPAVVNGNFQVLSGNTAMSGGWYPGVPANWTTAAPSGDGHEYSVRQVGSDNYANLNVLSSVSPNFAPLRQTIGTLATASDITVTFKATSLNGFPYDLGSAIYNAAGDVPLAIYNPPSQVNGTTTVTYTARGVVAGTEVYVGFWTPSGYAPGITDVTVSVGAAATTLTLKSGSALQLDAASPVIRTPQSLVFDPGSKVSVTGSPAGSAVLLLASTGSISGTPVLDPAVPGYTLGVTGKRLWLYADGSPSLAVFNGDFNNLAGLAALGGPWYGGVPADWTFTNPNNITGFSAYIIGAGDLAANLSILGIAYNGFNPLTQEVGTMDADGDVTVTFDILKPINSDAVAVGVALYHAQTNVILANVEIDDSPGPDSGPFSVTALDVPAGTPVRIAFWSGLPPTAFPFLDNVALSVTPTGDPGFAAWQTANNTAGALDEDHDNDGVSNGIEYFIGGTTLPAANTTGFTALPNVTPGSPLTVTWTKAATYTGTYGTHFRVETSETLSGAWSSVSEGVGADTVQISGNNITYTFPAGPAKKFARLVVTGP
jgi:hypothetical protein